jgi:hypothetical protein
MERCGSALHGRWWAGHYGVFCGAPRPAASHNTVDSLLLQDGARPCQLKVQTMHVM